MSNLSHTDAAPVFSLLNLFSQYYQQVGKIKACMLSKKPAENLAKLTNFGGQMSEADQPGIISEHLNGILQSQLLELKKYALAKELEAYQKCLYAMVALTDEIFLLELSWNGQNEWLDKNLEQQFFASTSAGEDLFQEIDKLLVSKQKNKLTSELASVYLLTLRLGFKGIHRDQNDETLVQYRSKLYRLIGNSDVFNSDAKLFGAAYDYLLNPLKSSKLPPLARWHTYSVVVFIVYSILSYVVWRLTVSPLYEITKGTFGG